MVQLELSTDETQTTRAQNLERNDAVVQHEEANPERR
jgi:hypothetical protein